MRLLFLFFVFLAINANCQNNTFTSLPDNNDASEFVKYSFGTNSKENFNFIIENIKSTYDIKIHKICENHNTMIIFYNTKKFKSEDVLIEWLKSNIEDCIIYKKQENSILKMCEEKFLKEK